MAVSGIRAIGACVERLTIVQRTYTKDTHKALAVETDTTVATVWAEFVPISIAERLRGDGAIGSQTTIRFRIRRRTDVTPQMFVQWTPTFPPGATVRTLEIRGVLPVDDGRTWMHLDCTDEA